jgi:hypothetical protein
MELALARLLCASGKHALNRLRIPIALLLGMLLTAGCAAWRDFSPETRAEEVTWQSLHAIDTAQTLSIARDPDCYYEMVSNPAIGRHPTPGPVLAWMTGTSVLHFTITELLTRNTSPGLVRFWEGLSIGWTGYWVSHNYAIGLRVFSHNEPTVGVCAERR